MTESYTFTGRVRKERPGNFFKFLWWCLLNDDEQKLDDGTTDWYLPGRRLWWRKLCWELRNPLQNLRCYVLGVQDRNYTVTGRPPALTTQRNDLPGEPWGLQWAILHGGDLRVPRPWFSLTFLGVLCAGWQPSGFFGFKTVGLWAAIPAGLVVWLLWLLWP